MSHYGSLYRALVFPAFQRFRGHRTELYWRQAELNQWKSPDELQALQWAKLQNLLEYAFRECPWYRHQFEHLGATPGDIRSVADFQRLPPLTKDAVREHQEELKAQGCRDRVYWHSTGGSTGKPCRFLINDDSYRRRQAIRMRAYAWAGAADGERVLYLWGPSRPLPSLPEKVHQKLENQLLRRKILNTMHLGEDEIHNCIRQHEVFRPAATVGYVSSLVTVARYALQHSIPIRSPQAVITAAESLYPADRALIEKAFGCSVYNSYGSREFMNIAMECNHHEGLHVHCDNLVVECVSNGRPVAPGDLGEFLITDLHNYGMPLIRYQIGDVGTTSMRRCSCGRSLPLMESVQGRTMDCLQLPNGKLLLGYMFTGLLLEKYTELEQIQVVQTKISELVVKVVVAPHLRHKASEYLRDLQERIGNDVQLRLELVPEIPKTESGKRRITISDLPPLQWKT